ncbi:MAG: family 20 glycosylhydrolase, partial [Anaerolineae bacterium]
PDAGPEVEQAAALLREELAAIGLDLAIRRDAPAAKAIGLRLSPDMKPESYRLHVASDGVTITGADRRGLIYGALALAQLARGAEIEACLVEDEPKMGIRGVHLYMPSRENVPFFRRLIRHLLAPMRYNTIFLEVGAGMAYDRHPEINAAWEEAKARADRGEDPGSPHIEVGGGSYLSKAEVRELVDYAEAHGIEVIPEVQSLSHVEFLTLAHPEIAEGAAEGRMDCYCPQDERSYELVFDMLDEVIEVFRPRRYIHMGHDEAYTMCVCEKCRGVPKAELFARDVRRIYDYLRGKGLGMMIWDDMVHVTRDFACPEALDLIPKDIVLLNFVWYDRMDLDTEDRLLEHGFPVMIGNFYSSHFPRFATREHKTGLVGAEVSTWYTASEEDYGRLGKLYDFLYSANMMWSPHYTDRLRWLYDRRICALLPALRDSLSGQTYPSRQAGATFQPIELGAAAAELRRDPSGVFGSYDLSTLPTGSLTLEGFPFTLGERVAVLATPRLRERRGLQEAVLPVHGRPGSVVFLQACTQPGTPSPYNQRGQPVARYAYLYADGTQAEVTVEYGWQLAEWDRRHAAPMRHSHWRHSGYIATYPSLPFWQGKTPQGEDVTLYGYEWPNPHPDKEVIGLAVSVPDGAGDAALILVAATAVFEGQ